MATTVTALFDSPQNAAIAVRTLESRGVSGDEISLVASENFQRESFGIDSHSKLPEGVALGAGTGGAIGALVAGLTAVGAIATGGAGVVVAGPVIAALAGAGAGATGGGIIGGLIGLVIPEHEVKHYSDAFEEGKVLVGVHCETAEDKRRAREALKDSGGEHISTA
ncbi:MAG: hypothetical protein IT430_17190 [Phycisphaerales bacterium]|nr:hypothetical protein [Phycisphaerales bacterium]